MANLAIEINYFLRLPGHHFTLVFNDGTYDIKPTDPNWTRLLEREDFVGVVSRHHSTQWTGMIGYPHVSGYAHRLDKQYAGKMSAARALRLLLKSIKDEEAKRQNDPLYALEEALKVHDWFYMYSDDGRVARAGRKSWEGIQDLLAKVPADKGQELLAKYRPKDF